MTALAPYRVKAFNTAHDSENKIHDDATAKRFGFGGGLVPGVDVYGYMSHMPVMRWGRAWLERGSAECRFLKPVYDGDEATVTATETADALEIAVESRGELSATGTASLPLSVPAFSIVDYPATAPVALATCVTILPLTASISASVRVRSTGCRVTAMASDFLPPGTPVPE